MADEPSGGDCLPRRNVRVAWLRLSLDEIPRPRIYTYWIDDDRCGVGFQIATRHSDPVAGVDVDIVSPPGWLARWIDGRRT